jgi:hypothetical protein
LPFVLFFRSWFRFWLCLFGRQQIRVSDALLPVAHSALYVADRELGISYHAFAVFSCGLCIPMSNTSHQFDPINLMRSAVFFWCRQALCFCC